MESLMTDRKNIVPLSISRTDKENDPLWEKVEKPIRQYLYFAFRRSTRDAESYENAASGLPEDDRHAFLLAMAGRKRVEAERLYAYYKADGARVLHDIRKRSIISSPHYQPEFSSSQIASMEDTYSFAFKIESKNFDLYSGLAGLDNNPHTQALFNLLAHLQLGHMIFIDGRLSGATGRSFEGSKGATPHAGPRSQPYVRSSGL